MRLIPQYTAIQAKINSKPEINKESPDKPYEGAMKFSRLKATVSQYTTLIVRRPELNLLANDRKRLGVHEEHQRVHLPPRVVAELGLNSIKPPPDMIEEVRRPLLMTMDKA